MKKLIAYWKGLPDYIKVGAWIGFSAAITAICSWLLQKPELFQYYGLLNFVLFTIKEFNKNRK
jgi:hypothetical protein